MSGATGMDSAAPNLNLTPEEKRIYGQLFRQADTDGVGVVTGEIAVKFFEKTRLDSRVLGEIWQIADKENRGFLTPAGFGIVLRLIGHAQAGREPTPEVALQPGPIPRFDGIWPPPTVSSPQPAAATLQAQNSGGPIRIPPLTPDKVAQYAGLFERQPLQANMLPGDQARQIFDKSGLPNEILGRIWGLADTEQRGALVLPEFVIAMHLLTSTKTGALRALPTVLPPGLYEAATMRSSGISARQSPVSTGIPAIPRQLSGSAQARTGSPLGRPPMSAQTTGPNSNDWLITPADKARFDQIYADFDKQGKGFITGEEAVPFLSQSNLPEDSLAQIWDLADFDSQGCLTREGFAVAMYLIRQQRSGRAIPLPTTLPSNLIPPSIRNRSRPPAALSAFDPPPMSQPAPPAPKSALEDLFGLDSSTPSLAPTAPHQMSMSTGGSNANDPFAGGSVLSPTSPIKPSSPTTSFRPFTPASSFGRGLAGQPTGESRPSGQSLQRSASEDLLSDHDAEASKITGETTELANLSNQITSLSKQTQEVQAKRTTVQHDLNQTNSQKQNFEQRLAQLRQLYEKEAQDTQALEDQLRKSRADTKRLQEECMSLEGTYRDVQTQHQQVSAALQVDQQENGSLREKIRVANAEIAQLKPQIEKLKLEARQQKGLVAINKKQLSTTEGERDKSKAEVEMLVKSSDEASRQAESGSPVSTSAQVASPALSTASGNNPFFKRSASTDIMGVFASPPARTFSSDRSFDEVFGPSGPRSSTNTPPPPVAAFKQQHTGASSASAGSFSNASMSAAIGRHANLAAEPPAPPESRQITPSFLPFSEPPESLSSSRHVSPPASRAGSSANGAYPFPITSLSGDDAGTVPAVTLADDNTEQHDTPGSTPMPASPGEGTPRPAETDGSVAGASASFDSNDQAKAKADFDNAFAAFTTSKTKGVATTDTVTSTPTFATEFPPISELERDDDSDSDSERGGFEDDFAPASPENKGKKASITEHGLDSNLSSTEPFEPVSSEAAKEPALAAEPALISSAELPSSPATITNNNGGTSHESSADDIFFGSAPSGPTPSASQILPPNPPVKGAFDDLDDDFEGLEDAKEGSADDDFANISRSGLDDFNPMFDSSPPASQAKSESTAFGNESSFDFISSNSAVGVSGQGGSTQQKGADPNDWDAIFSGLDSPNPGAASSMNNSTTTAKEDNVDSRPSAPGRALTEQGEHDDPILKNLTGMGYTRPAALAALEKYNYNLEKAANYLASQS